MLLFGSLFLHSVGLLKAFLFPQTRNRDSVLKALNGHSDHRQIEMKKILPKSPSDFLCKCVQSCFFYHNNTVSVFHIRRYGATDENLLRNIHYSALKQTQIDVQTLEGQMEREVLLAGIIDGSFRSGLKAEIGILFPMLILRVLENVLQPSFLQKMTILNLLDKIGGDSQIIIGILVNYDCDVDSPNIFERYLQGCQLPLEDFSRATIWFNHNSVCSPGYSSPA
ncbi:hypothetical protein J1N35_041766 [Gossypium stocksii]|uniref:Mon2/Sec7/BIG1-like HUS domain-containing protein n=1 Tax=Gossypium stocksii TaxID=47602 RepID=A0A9D3UGK4_9ROSI|nr:hypothetical protein J1N35_041766 [Gossypium stocksii]